jgi:hypothetical protein
MIRGSCLCGGVEFEIDGRLTPIQCCHATRCRKSTGAAFAPEIATRTSSFRWVRGEELITRYEAPLLREPPPFRKAFCSVCGSPVPLVEQDSEFVAFLAGVLDGEPETTPFRHVFLSQKAPWYSVNDELTKFDERPPADQRLPRKRES